MRRFAVALGAALLTAPAIADMYQDSSNAKLPEARQNLGLGPAVSITDYGADPTGAASSEAAFTSCITSGKDCRIPAGTYLLSCNAHTATANTAVLGDGAKASILKLPPACTIGPWSVLQASEVRDFTVDVNNATSAAAVVVALTPGIRPKAERIAVINGTTGMHLIGLVTAGVNTTDPVVSHNYLHLTAPSTGGNHCVLFSGSGGGTITGGSIDHNVCVNTAMIVRANGLSLTDNDISGWNYGGGIVTEASTGSSRYLIARNRLHDSGTLLDSDNTAAIGIESWGPDSTITDNQCWNLGGGCVANGGLRSLIANNWARGVNKHNYPVAAAYDAMAYTTYRADYSQYTGNWAGDDGSGIPMYGYQEQAGGFTGIVLAGNNFDGATSGRINPVNLSAATRIDAPSKTGGIAGTALVASKTVPAALEFTSLDTANYGAFKLNCFGLQPGVGVTDIGIQVGTGATPTWVTAGYGSALTGTHTGTAAALVRNTASAASVPVNVATLLAASANLMQFEVNFGDFGHAGFAKIFTVSGGYPITPAAIASSFGSGSLGSVDALTAIRVIGVGGNIDYGTCRLYGLI